MLATEGEALAAEEAKIVKSKPAESNLFRLSGSKLFGCPQGAKLWRQRGRNPSERNLPSLVRSGCTVPSCSAGHSERIFGVRGGDTWIPAEWSEAVLFVREVEALSSEAAKSVEKKPTEFNLFRLNGRWLVCWPCRSQGVRK